MSIYNFFLTRVFLPVGDIVFSTTFTKQLKRVTSESELAEVKLIERQRQNLHKLLIHATSRSHYYKTLGVNINRDPVLWLKQFPILTKEILNREQTGLLTQSIDGLFKHNSSGSSGIQATIYLSQLEQDIDRATQVLWWRWAGYEIGNPILQTGMNPNRSLIKRVKDYFFQTRFIMAFAHTASDIELAMQWASKQKNPIIGGYASSVYVIAKTALEKGISVPFKTAIVWGDKLFDHYRQVIEKAFNTKVYETYGTAEGFKIGTQKDLPYLYIMTNHVYVELLDDNGREVEDGKMGHVIVTSLNSFAMPLIRYRIGDMAIRLPRDRYPEKRDLNFPLFEKVVGRDTDLVKTRSGKYMVVHSFTGIIEHFPEIKQFSVIQDNLDSILIEYIPGNGFKESILETIRGKIAEHVGNELRIEFGAVKHIMPTKSGKPQIIRSSLPKNEL